MAANVAVESTAFLAIVTYNVVVCGRRRIGKRSLDVLHEFIVIHNAQSPNEMELSHRWRGRAWQTRGTVSQNQTWTSQRPAVGSSDWLGLLCCIKLRVQRHTTERTKAKVRR